MRAALYARVSSEEQVEGYSLDAQLRACRNFTQEKGWAIAAEYVDEGKSARSDDISKRPRFKEILQAAKRREFDVLIVHKLDRFARNLLTTLKCFDDLSQSGITFISVSEQIDYTTPMGRVFLAMSGAFAQFYSDNLSQETKKGWHERKLQGLYCGALPFGAMKGDDDIPVPDTQERKITIDRQEVTVRNYEGLRAAFDLAAKGKSDRQVAITLNAAGYRTTGTHGSRPFSRDTVKDMLNNKFYIGLLPDGNGAWLKAKHEPLVAQEVFEETQKMREKNRTSTHKHTTQGKTVYSLTGITYCWYCRDAGREGRMHIACVKNGKPRIGCYNRIKGWDCQQKSASLEIYDKQLGAYLETFHIPEDYQQRIMEMQRNLLDNYDIEKEQRQLTARLDRVKDLYKWGDITAEEYQRDKDQIQRELAKLTPFQDSSKALQRLAELLGSVAKAWERATQEQRNMLARCVFQEIWIKDKNVVAVKSQPEFEPFFAINWEEYSKIMKMRPRGDSGSNVQYTAYLVEMLCPQIQCITAPRWKSSSSLWAEIIQ